VPASTYRFGPFVLDRGAYRLRRSDQALESVIELPPKALDLLLYLVERPGALVTKEEAFQVIWPDVIVTDNALTQVVSEIRQAIGDSPSDPKYLQTVARRGYRFIGEVSAVDPHATAVSGPGESAPPVALPSVAIVDFVNMSHDPSIGWLSAGIPETVVGDLSGLGCFRIIDRARVTEASVKSYRGLEIARILGADLLVSGSFQRAGDRLRLSARLIDTATGEVRADAKADGRLEDVFQLQDEIGRQFGEGLGIATPVPVGRARQTSNLEAYKNAVEGRLRLESFEADSVPKAVDRFKRAIELDPGYAPAYVGLANAQCQLFERARFLPSPPADALADAQVNARRGVELDNQYAEAHATLAFVLTSAGKRDEARRAARTAVSLEPSQWMHQFRLGYAAWGSERLEALGRALELYPDFAFAHFQIAMVHIARGALAVAASALRDGIAIQASNGQSPKRFPAHGLHWLLGAIALARNDIEAALASFESECASGNADLYAQEFALAATCGRGVALTAMGKMPEAIETLTGALPRDASGRAALLLAAIHHRLGDTNALGGSLAAAGEVAARLRSGGRNGEAAVLEAASRAVRGEAEAAASGVQQAVAAAPNGPFGWFLPIDPLFASVRDLPAFQTVLETIADRAA
jgi:DNA-binding winged helix-turn-helix (wHTH) protein/tetratricopeptide (TPR) repeat protein